MSLPLNLVYHSRPIQYPLIAASKSVLAYRRVGRMFVRPPLINLTRAQEEEMLGRLKEAHLLS